MRASECNRIVIKVGTSTLTHKTGNLNLRRVEALVKVLADLQNSGREIVLVTSGAIGLGMAKMGLSSRPTDTPSKQACAAVGQCELMHMYDKLFSEYNVTIAQVLLTKNVVENDRRVNVFNTMNKLIEKRVIPVVNENDTVAIDELELDFGENDTLAAIVADVVKADLLVILSDIDGLFDKNPKEYPDAKIIPVVEEITDEIISLAGGTGSFLGTGGMATKIKAAKLVKESGIDMVIANGENPKKLYDLFENKEIGTYFKA